MSECRYWVTGTGTVYDEDEHPAPYATQHYTYEDARARALSTQRDVRRYYDNLAYKGD